ncbi:hypothetical protein AAG906_024579 [Vitis piasezkii]
MEWKELHGSWNRYEKQVPRTLYRTKVQILKLELVECHLLLGGLVAAMWAATSCLGAWRPLYKGGLQLVLHHFTRSKLGLERETRERKCRFEVSKSLSSIYCLCGTVGPWVKVPKALEEDTPMWVYGLVPYRF